MDKKLSYICIGLLVIIIVLEGGLVFSSIHWDNNDYDDNNFRQVIVDSNHDDVDEVDDNQDTTASSSDDSQPSSSGHTYVGSVKSDKFHELSCPHVKKIKEANKITFSSRQDALDAGYTPCRTCNP
ncbi:Ada metal-binding domain-containing protein [Methanobrevibacter sp.]|uniref:Ada metal-binding domain-containing protein n=1 Tax=Methanobrevibacter sp. TaxID=66852 RepID=UPI0025DA5545|nr:Ada metal-binding domain-containing protein [Methanobrevibacter sp.]MBQ2831160.1 hypothetical protein [Methanobrevibacter sp.]